MRLMSWNILHGGGRRVDRILEVLAEHQPDLLCVQEFRHGEGGARLLAGLARLGLSEVAAPATAQARDNTVMTASCWPLEWASFPTGAPLPVRGVESRIATGPLGGVTILNVHSPQKRPQVPFFASLGDWSRSLDCEAALLGDLNNGVPFVDSDTDTFDNTHQFTRLLVGGGSARAAGGTDETGLIDAWRSRHEGVSEFSWVSAARQNGFRYDHALVTPGLDLRISETHYDHTVREHGISDHSALLVDLD